MRTAGHTNASIRLLTVIPAGSKNGHRKQAQKYLQRQEELLHAAGLDVECAVSSGDPGDQILRESTEFDLTVMTSGTVRWLISAVLDRVLQDMSRPLVVVRANSEPASEDNPRCILVPVDDAVCSSDVLGHVRDMAVSVGASVTLCHVMRPIGNYVTTGNAPPGVARIMEGMIEDSRDLMADAAAGLCRHGIEVKPVTVFGDPAEAIVREAQNSSADLIAMATRGRDRLHKRVEGSVAQTVIESTRIPCLLVKPSVPDLN